MKRATLLLNDEVYYHAKRLSQSKGMTMKQLINDLLVRGLKSFQITHPIKFVMPLHKKNVPVPGVDISDRDSLYDSVFDSKNNLASYKQKK